MSPSLARSGLSLSLPEDPPKFGIVGASLIGVEPPSAAAKFVEGCGDERQEGSAIANGQGAAVARRRDSERDPGGRS